MHELKLKLDSSDKAKIFKMHKKEGDSVKKDEAIFEIETDKNNIQISADIGGIIESINVNEGDEVQADTVLALINEEKEASSDEKDSENKTEEEMVYKEEPGSKTVEEVKTSGKINEGGKFDIAILGAGPGGYVAAIKAAQLGAKVALVEKDKPGGTCLNRGCIPTKALVRSAEVYRILNGAEQYGCSIDGISFDWKKIQKRKDRVVNKLVGGIYHLLDSDNIELFNGKGTLVSPDTIEIEDNITLNADNIIIATGSESASLPIEGADLPGVIDSRMALELKELPEKMVIIGGGVIGLEFAFIFAAFGVEVTVVEYLDCVVNICDTEICQEITRIGREKGIRIITGARVNKISRGMDDSYSVSFEKNGNEEFVSADQILMAVGRKPLLTGIDADKLGLELNERGQGIKVNEKMETSMPGLYAIGDVTNKIQLAHVASHQGIVAVKNIMGEECEMDYNAVPSAIFTDPEIGEVGICEEQAKKDGFEVNTGRFPFAANGKALTVGSGEGFIKIVTEKETNRIIGASIIGVHATDLLAELTLAIKNKLSAEEVAETIHAHPTTAEVIHEAALDVGGRALHYKR